MENVLIFRRALLPISETFIEAQAGALRSYRPQYAGLFPAAKSLNLAHHSILVSPTRSLRSLGSARFYDLTGIGPRFHRRARLARPALIHAHFALDGATALPLAAALGVPLVVTLHGYDVTMGDKYLGKTLAGRLYLRRRQNLWKRASLFLCVSEFIRSKALEAGFPKEKLRVHFIGIDRHSFLPAGDRAGKEVVFVGRLVEKKGCIHLLRAMRRVQDVEPDARLMIVGDGPLRASLEQSAQELKIQVQFLGSQPASVVRESIRRASLLCIPSVTGADGASEGLGMVILEAQAMGRPVVGFRSGGIPEAINEGQTGLLAPAGDEASLAQQILRYLQDEALWQSSSVQGIDWVAKRFDLDRQTRELEDLYRACQA